MFHPLWLGLNNSSCSNGSPMLQYSIEDYNIGMWFLLCKWYPDFNFGIIPTAQYNINFGYQFSNRISYQCCYPYDSPSCGGRSRHLRPVLPLSLVPSLLPKFPQNSERGNVDDSDPYQNHSPIVQKSWKIYRLFFITRVFVFWFGKSNFLLIF